MSSSSSKACDDDDLVKQLRLSVLEDFCLLDDTRDPVLQDAAKLVALACNCPRGFISFVDWKTGCIRFQNNFGFGDGKMDIVRGESFCDESVLSENGSLEVNDAREHPRFHNSRFVTGDPRVVFYHSVGLVLDEKVGLAVGVLSVVDFTPRSLDANQREMLNLAAKNVVRHLQLKRALNASLSRETSPVKQPTDLDMPERSRPRSFDMLTHHQANAQFAATLSHELRTPTNIIHCSTVLLRTIVPQGGEAIDYIELVEEGVRQLRVALDKGSAHLDAQLGLLKFEASQWPLNSLLTAVANETTHPKLLQGRTVTVSSVDPRMPNNLIGDYPKVGRVLNYLVENAIKFSDFRSGEIQVRVVVLSRDEQTASVVAQFQVQDDGIGIKPDLCENIFNPYVAADRSTTREHDGLGFGLFICQKLSVVLAGEISVISKRQGTSSPVFGLPAGFEDPFPKGHGSMFNFTVRFTYDRNRPEHVPLHLHKANNPQPLSPSPSAANPSKAMLNILIVEDNLLNQRVLSRILDKLGYPADIAADGAQAVKMFCFGYKYDLILMDLHMPKLDGLAATRTILDIAQGLRRKPKIYAVTSSAGIEDRNKCMECGMSGFITKPITVAALEDAINSTLTDQS